MKKYLAFILLFIIVPCFAEKNSDQVITLINERLSYMEDVGYYKAIHYQPVEDQEREKLVLEKAQISAEQAGLDGSSTRAFFLAQISAAKAIQYRYRADLLTHPEPEKAAKDLHKEVRPALIKLGQNINQVIAEHLKEQGRFSDQQWPAFAEGVSQRYLSEKDKLKLFKALQEVQLKSP